MLTVESVANELTPGIRENNSEIGVTNQRLALIGDGEGNPQPEVLLTPRDVNYRSLDGSETGIAILDSGSGIPIDQIDGYYDLEVWIANVPKTNQVVILKLADGASYGTGGPTPAEAQVRDAAFPDQSRLVVLRIGPSFTTGMSIYVDIGPYPVRYVKADNTYGFLTSSEVDISDPTDPVSYDPTTVALAATEHRILGIAFSRTTGRYYVIPGAIKNTTNTLPSSESRSEFEEADYLAIDFGSDYACGYMYNYFGQSDPDEDDCRLPYDPRLITQPSEAAGVSADNKFALAVTWDL